MIAVKLILFCAHLWAVEIPKGPFFWQKDAGIAERMRTQGYIPVSVISENGVWIMKGAGFVHAPMDYSFKFAKDFSKLRDLKNHFEKVEYDAAQSTLTLEILILGVKRALKLKLKEKSSLQQSELSWEVIEGSFLGSQGVLLVKAESPKTCEISIVGVYPGSVPWAFGWMFSVALEGFMDHVARMLKKVLEASWEANRANRT